MLKLLQVFSLYIQSVTGMPSIPMAEMPYVEQMDICSIQMIFEGPQHKCTTDGVHVGAVYMVQLDRIVMPDTTDLNKAMDASMLLHELVHAQQRHDPRMLGATCIQLEVQAYEVQMRWLEEVAHLNPVDVIGWESAGAGAVASCAGK